MADGRPLRLLLILVFYASAVVECLITSSPGDKTVCAGQNLDLDWVYGDAANFFTVTWAFIDGSSPAISILEQVNGNAAEIKNNFNVVHKTNGGITLTSVTQANTGSYKISVDYSSVTSPADNTVIVTVNDCSSTTVPPTAPTTPPSTPSTTTISPVVIIVPSVVGGAAFVILIICIIVCKLLRKKSNRGKKYRADSKNEEIPQVDINVTKQQ